MTVVADSSPLIILAKIEQTHVLAECYGCINITPDVYEEVVTAGEGRAGASLIAEASWIQVKSVSESELKSVQGRFGLGAGETSTILLGLELAADLVIMDDRQARRAAESQGLTVLGCVGVLEVAFRRGLIESLTSTYRNVLACGAYVNSEILQASLRKLKQPPM